MNKEVIIKVKGIQGSFMEEEAIEMITTGQYYQKSGKIYIKYEDSALDEDQITSTTIKIDEDQVSILRFGATNTQMIFEKEKDHYTPYETPFGLFELMLRTKDIQLKEDADHMTLAVDYTIDVNGTGGTASQFVVDVTNRDGDVGLD